MRVAKVVSLTDDSDVHVQCTLGQSSTINVEYLPCVATFDSYENDEGETIRYLASVEYHGSNGRQKGSSLASFFDEEDGIDDSHPTFPGVAAVAIGAGIETPEDASMIETFVRTLQGERSEKQRPTIVQYVKPNPEYSSMTEENEAYKSLDLDAKQEASRRRTIGPGKMMKFASNLAKSVVDLTCSQKQRIHTVDDDVHDEHAGECIPEEEEFPNESKEDLMRNIDPKKVRFACRKCRTILFGHDDLFDHVPSRHSFSRRHASASSRCESLFLSGSLGWMGYVNAPEGKFDCPKCESKLGHWKWSGAQCSCGTWVTPAIQVPLSKVDRVDPFKEGPPPGGILSPTVLLS